MKTLRTISFILLFLSLCVLALVRFADLLPDWTLRIAGVGMLLGIPGLVYSIQRLRQDAMQAEKVEKKKEK